MPTVFRQPIGNAPNPQAKSKDHPQTSQLAFAFLYSLTHYSFAFTGSHR
jgi:hypothetical protein